LAVKLRHSAELVALAALRSTVFAPAPSGCGCR
jgi:hypothetical protein